MQEHSPQNVDRIERLNLREQAWPLYVTAQILGLVGLAATVLLGYFQQDDFRRFFYSYLAEYLFFLAIALGGLFFVLLQHATRAGWSVNVRRIAEWFASSLPMMGVLSAPIVIAVALGRSQLYPWAGPEYHATGFKGWYLQPGFFIGRLVFFFVVWSIIGVWYWKQSVKQDETGDITLTSRMQFWASPALVFFGLSVTYAMWDWIMSLDPVWYSTIFGVYFFAGSTLAVIASLIITVHLLQSQGLLQKSVTIEHFHDLGKFLFGFVFFWGYIAFSQFMLYWYSNIPKETEWFVRHGGSTMQPNEFSPVIIALLFGHFLIPFPGLFSRHVKRRPKILLFWAIWCLAFCWLDIFWMVMPQFQNGIFHFGLIDFAAFIGVGGIFVAFIVRKASHDSVRPTRDPRLVDSLAFENY